MRVAACVLLWAVVAVLQSRENKAACTTISHQFFFTIFQHPLPTGVINN